MHASHRGRTATALAWSVSAAVVLCLSWAAFASGPGPWRAPSYAARKKNPVPADAQSIERGRKAFEQNCAACHGKGAKGDGPAGRYLRPPAADLTSDGVRRQTDGELFWKIQHGRSPMPAFRKVLEDERIWDIVNFLRHLAPPKPAGKKTNADGSSR